MSFIIKTNTDGRFFPVSVVIFVKFDIAWSLIMKPLLAILIAFSLFSITKENDKMELLIVAENTSQSPELMSTWGFSCLIGEETLFDVSGDYKVLKNNMEKLNIDCSRIRRIALSHKHGDHIGALPQLLEHCPNLKEIYVCDDFKRTVQGDVRNYQIDVLSLDEMTEIDHCIYISSCLEGKYKGTLQERYCIIDLGKNIGVITGCAHPGIVRIVKDAKDEFPNKGIEFVLGGFHLHSENIKIIKDIADKLKSMGVEKAGPAHCSGENARRIFKEVFGEDYLVVGSGSRFEFTIE